ncbi:MAG: winged helix-turn-helix domain-containing protein [Methanoregulaceae archaeon]|jgi:predicted transcriptional regulator
MADLLSIVTSSDKRKNLLVLLQSGPSTWEEIRDTLQVTPTGMLPQIKILIERGLVGKDRDGYYLTDIGTSVARHLIPFIQVTDVFDRLKGYLSDHDFSVIPPPFQHCIGDIGHVLVNEVKTADIFVPHKDFLDNIRTSKRVTGISPVMYPSYPAFFVDRAREGMDIDIVMTPAIFSRLRDEYRAEVVEGLDLSNLHLYVSEEDIRFACIATDKYLWLSIFTWNGIYDPKTELISYDPSARQWGERLVHSYIDSSREISRDQV